MMLKNLRKWNYFKKLYLSLYYFPKCYITLTPLSSCSVNKNGAQVQLLLQLLEPTILQDKFSSSKILKKLQLSKSIQEVLLLSSQNTLEPEELAASLRTIKQHEYSLLSSKCWAYYNNERILWVQSKINKNIQKSFSPLLNSPEFIQICNALENSYSSLSNTDLVVSFHSLLRLHFPCDHKLSILLQQECLQKFCQFNLMELSLFVSIGNMLQRNGIFVNCLNCGHLENILNEIELSSENIKHLADILCHIDYFLSSDFIKQLQTKVIKMMKEREIPLS